MKNSSEILEVQQLSIQFKRRRGNVDAVKGISFSVPYGKTLAVVGESGSGKSVTAMACTQLLPKPPICEVSGEIWFEGRNLLALSEEEIRTVRGSGIAYIFQEPSTSLNPVYTIGFQIAEAIHLHIKNPGDVHLRVIELLDLVGIRDPEKRFGAYPHELSGGMQQRVMIAIALACEPKLLIADEPTTALDVTIQKQIMDLLLDLKRKLKMSIILITHNFGIVNGFADEVMVLFRGEVVEFGSVKDVLKTPRHPYTKALIGCIPRLNQKKRRLTTIDHEIVS